MNLCRLFKVEMYISWLHASFECNGNKSERHSWGWHRIHLRDLTPWLCSAFLVYWQHISENTDAYSRRTNRRFQVSIKGSEVVQMSNGFSKSLAAWGMRVLSIEDDWRSSTPFLMLRFLYSRFPASEIWNYWHNDPQRLQDLVPSSFKLPQISTPTPKSLRAKANTNVATLDLLHNHNTITFLPLYILHQCLQWSPPLTISPKNNRQCLTHVKSNIPCSWRNPLLPPST